MLTALDSIHRAVDASGAIRACESFRASLIRQHDRLAIGAEALRLLLQTRKGDPCIDVESRDWMEFFYLAKDVDRTQKQMDCEREQTGDVIRKTGNSAVTLRYVHALVTLQSAA